MKFSSAVIKSVSLSVAMFLSLTVNSQRFQPSPKLAPLRRDYSFTISTTQPWTDTGVDLQAGDISTFHASPAGELRPGGSESSHPCSRSDTESSGGHGSGRSPDREAAGAGSSRSRRQQPTAQSRRTRSSFLWYERRGYERRGNKWRRPKRSSHARVQLLGQGTCANTGSAPQAAVPGKALTAATSSATPSTATPAAQPTGQTPSAQTKTAPQDIKSKLASAAQVFLAGQFGTGALRQLFVGRASRE